MPTFLNLNAIELNLDFPEKRSLSCFILPNMAFVGSKLTDDETMIVMASVWVLARQNKRRFLRIMAVLVRNHCFRIRDAAPTVNGNRAWDAFIAESNTKVDFSLLLKN